MNKTFCVAIAAILSICITCTSVCAQKTKGGVFNLANYTLVDGGIIERPVNETFQGFAIHKNYMIGLNNTGHASLYRLQDDGSFTKLNSFNLGSHSKHNHANVADFGVEYYAKGDAMPVLYVSQCQKGTLDTCYVERISPEGKAELVQSIVFEAHDKYYGYAVQWVVDKKKKLLIGFGNTIQNYDPKNQLRITVFKLPKLKDGKAVVLKEADIIETYVIQDYDKTFPNVQVGQGAVIAGNCIIMPTGIGLEKYPSVIYSWDLKNHKMVSAINMQGEVPFEFEDCDFYNDRLYIQCNYGSKGHMMIMEWNKK